MWGSCDAVKSDRLDSDSELKHVGLTVYSEQGTWTLWAFTVPSAAQCGTIPFSRYLWNAADCAGRTGGIHMDQPWQVGGKTQQAFKEATESPEHGCRAKGKSSGYHDSSGPGYFCWRNPQWATRQGGLTWHFPALERDGLLSSYDVP